MSREGTEAGWVASTRKVVGESVWVQSGAASVAAESCSHGKNAVRTPRRARVVSSCIAAARGAFSPHCAASRSECVAGTQAEDRETPPL